MKNILDYVTDGEWKAHGGEVISSTHICVANSGTRHYPEVSKRIAEREANARLIAQSKRMYKLILDMQYTPLSDVAIELQEIIRDVEGLQDDGTYEHP